MVSRKARKSGTQNHAQDCGTLIVSCDSVPRSCHGLDASDGVHPSVLVRGEGVSPSTRATGTLPVIVQSPECCWTNFCRGTRFSKTLRRRALMRAIDDPHDMRMIFAERPKSRLFSNHAQERARRARVKHTNSTPNVVLFNHRMVTRLVLLLEVIEKRTARGDHFQESAA